MTKEYLKMEDVFDGDMDGRQLSGWKHQGKYVPLKTIQQYAAHAINSHDELVAEVARLRGALHDAATSLETIHIRSFGEESMLDSKQEMRAYAGARAMVARKDLIGK